MLVSSPLGQVCPTMINAGDRGLPLLDVSPSSSNTLSAWDGSRAQGCVCFLSCPRARRQPTRRATSKGGLLARGHKSAQYKPTGLEDSPPLYLCHAPTQPAHLPQPLAMNPAKTETGESLGGATLGLVHLCPHWLASCRGTTLWKSLRKWTYSEIHLNPVQSLSQRQVRQTLIS